MITSPLLTILLVLAAVGLGFCAFFAVRSDGDD